jgi:hypothetical protein
VPWQAPQYTEIDMNAEIGAYQRDPLPDAEPLTALEPAGDPPGAATLHDPAPDVPSNRR